MPSDNGHIINSNEFSVLITKEKFDFKVYKKHLNKVEILIKSPKDVENEPGIILEILNKFFQYNINIIEMYSCYINTIIIIDKENLINAINLLNELNIN